MLSGIKYKIIKTLVNVLSWLYLGLEKLVEQDCVGQTSLLVDLCFI